MNTKAAQSITAILTACGCKPATVAGGVKVNAPHAEGVKNAISIDNLFYHRIFRNIIQE
jgi:hypothetical protein